MGQYVVGPSWVALTGHPFSVSPGSTVEHDFSIAGPDGEHGPAREAALIASGALIPVAPPLAERSGRRPKE